MKRFATEAATHLFWAVLFFGSGYFVGQARWAPISLMGVSGSTPPELREQFLPFWESWDAINREFYSQPIPPEQLIEGAITGMLATLEDEHTAYLTPEEEEASRQQMEQEFQGIGAEVENNEGNITIVSPFEGSPAEAAGLRPRDIIRSADGVDLTGMDVSEAAALVRGPAGTEVRLVIERDGEPFEITITRAKINIPSVRGEMLENNIAYVRLSRFADKTTAELEETLTTLMAQNPIGLILDLRGNPGGGLYTVVQVADQFLPESVVLIERFGTGEEQLFEATDSGLAQDVPLVVLVDEGSASASEVLAGAIRDHGRGTLVGQTTYGKGTVQNWLSLSNGGGLRLTTARWLTPDGNWVHTVGLVPDVSVALPDTPPGEPFVDTQLEEALQLLGAEQ